MNTRPIPLLVLLLSLPITGLGEETNETSSLFGVTVTNTVTEAEKQFQLGHAYRVGDGVEQDLSKAIECFKKAGELGHGQAQFNLGLCFMNGTGVEHSDKEAAQWFKKASEQGIKEALYPLGICYYNLGQYTEAYAWALFAEESGDTRLKEMLEPMYSEEDIAVGRTRFEELKKAAEQINDKKRSSSASALNAL